MTRQPIIRKLCVISVIIKFPRWFTCSKTWVIFVAVHWERKTFSSNWSCCCILVCVFFLLEETLLPVLSLLLTRTPLRVRYRSDFINSYCRWKRWRWWSRACYPFSVLPFRSAVFRVLSILCGGTWSLGTQWRDIVPFRCWRNDDRLRCFHSEHLRQSSQLPE